LRPSLKLGMHSMILGIGYSQDAENVRQRRSRRA
jgi:hypothetical protein